VIVCGGYLSSSSMVKLPEFPLSHTTYGLREDGSHWRRERPIQNYVYFTLKSIKEGSCYKCGVFEFCTEHFPFKETWNSAFLNFISSCDEIGNRIDHFKA